MIEFLPCIACAISHEIPNLYEVDVTKMLDIIIAEMIKTSFLKTKKWIVQKSIKNIHFCLCSNTGHVSYEVAYVEHLYKFTLKNKNRRKQKSISLKYKVLYLSNNMFCEICICVWL